MTFRQLDVNGDWTFGKGTANYAVDEKAIDLNIRTTILSWKGDCFFDLQAGLNWRELLDTGQQDRLDIALHSLILQVEDVVGVDRASANFDPVTRELKVTYNVTTVFDRNYQSVLDTLSGDVGE
jgi:hypothetical protein